MTEDQRSFDIGLWPTVGTLVGLALLLSLGTWQANRYVDKKEREELQQEREALPPLELSSLSKVNSEKLAYRRTTLRGSVDTSTKLIIKHRTFNGNPGVWLVQPFKLADGDGVILVNRGWIPFEQWREGLQSYGNDQIAGEITGIMHRLPQVIAEDDNRQKIEASELQVEGAMTEWDSFDVEAIYDALDHPTPDEPIVFVLEARTDGDRYPAASLDHVTEPYLTSGRHLSYALFWYAVALALIGIYVAAGFGALQSRARGKPRNRDV